MVPSPSLYMDFFSSLALRNSGLSPAWGDLFNGASAISVMKTDASSNDKSVADTVGMMGNHSRVASASSQVREALQEAGCLQEGLSEDEVIERVFHFIKGKVRFVEDEQQLSEMFQQPDSKELLITPPVLLGMKQPMGDCDDFSMLCCSMLMAKGIQCDFVTVAANGSQPTEFSHVYCMARTRDGRNIPLDTSHGREVGWETSKQYRKMVWPMFTWAGRRGVDGDGRLGRGGLGMTLDTVDSPTKRVKFGRAWENRFSLAGLGDDLSDLIDSLSSGVDPTAVMTGPTLDVSSINTGGSSSSVSAPSAPSSNIFANLLPGLFGSVEKIAVQTTQQPGYQTTGPNGQTTSYVLPAGSTNLPNIPGLSTLTGSSGGSLLLLLVAGVALFAFMDHK